MDEHGADEHGAGTNIPGQPVGGPQPAPWAPEVLDSVTAPTWSVLPDGQFPGGPAPAGRRRGRAVVAGITAVAVLLTAGAAYAAWSRLNGGGPQPAEVLPATTVAFAEVDLDPSAGQKLALLDLLRKFPDSSGLLPSDKDFGDWLVRRLSETGSAGDALDFGKDVEPWLGQRFALAAVPAQNGAGVAGSPVDGVVVVQETDEKAAAAAMDKLRSRGSEHLGYAFMNGYLVVTPDSDRAAARVVAAAQTAPLATDGRFSADVASLGSDQVVTAWVDATRAGGLLAEQMGAIPGVDAGQLDAVLGSSWKGRWVLGIHAADRSVEMRMRTFGGPASAVQPEPVRIEHVVADPIAVLAVSGAGASLADRWKQLSTMPGYQQLDEQATAAGLELPDDLVKLFGDQLTLSVGGDLTQRPSFLAAARSQDPQAGKDVLDKLFSLAGPGGAAGLDMTAKADGDTLYVGSSDSVVAGARGSGAAAKVTDSELFQEAVADPEHAQAILYVNLAMVWSALKASGASVGSPELQNLKAIGLSATTSGGDSDVTVRVVVG